MIKILTFTTLYPNNKQNRHGVFVEQRLRHLLKAENIQAKVVAPVPYFPVDIGIFGKYSQYAGVKSYEIRYDIPVYHPKYLVIPKIGMNLAPMLLARGSIGKIKQIIRDGYDFDVIDAHYFYPDGVAAAIIAKKLNKPLVITARGTDVNLIPKYKVPRKKIQWAARRADEIVTVCQALKDELGELGVDRDKVTVLRNGVDLKLFRPIDIGGVIKKRDPLKKTLLSVGHLIKRKGHDLVIRAIKDLPGYELIIIGDGEEYGNLSKLVLELSLQDRVTFVQHIDHDLLKEYYASADALILASSREGWPNVLLESMACGTPVIATSVWGSPEVIKSKEAGVLVRERSHEAIVNAVVELFNNYPDRKKTRHYAEQFSWDDTSKGQQDLFSQLLSENNNR